jgi:hypothetical protein
MLGPWGLWLVSYVSLGHFLDKPGRGKLNDTHSQVFTRHSPFYCHAVCIKFNLKFDLYGSTYWKEIWTCNFALNYAVTEICIKIYLVISLVKIKQGRNCRMYTGCMKTVYSVISFLKISLVCGTSRSGNLRNLLKNKIKYLRDMVTV